MESIEYDVGGRLQYSPEFHPNHGKPMSEEDLEYMCKYYEIDGRKSISLALGRTEMTIASKVARLRAIGKYDYYKNLNKHW